MLILIYCFGLVYEIIKQDEELSYSFILVYILGKELILLVCEDEKALP